MKNLIFIITILSTLQSFCQTDACSVFARYGYYEETSTTSESEYFRRILRYYQRQEFESISEAEEMSGNLGIDLGDIAGDLGLSRNEYTLTQLNTKITEYLNDETHIRSRDDFKATRANVDIAKLVAECDSKGIRCKVIEAQRYGDFVLKVDFSPVMEGKNSAKIKYISVHPENAASFTSDCNGRRRFPMKVGVGGCSYSFDRKTDSSFLVTIGTNIADGTFTLTIPSKPTPKPTTVVNLCDKKNASLLLKLTTANVSRADTDDGLTFVFVGKCGTFTKTLECNHKIGKEELHVYDYPDDIGDLQKMIVTIFRKGNELSDWMVESIEINDQNRGKTYSKRLDKWFGDAPGSIMSLEIPFD